MPIARNTASLLVVLALVSAADVARAETINCSAITALPAVITVQGVYCFTGDLATAITTGNAIDIQANNVVLDLNGFKLGGLNAGPATTAYGIYALDRQNLTVKNGTIRGFYHGIQLESNGASQGHVIEDIRADRNTGTGIQVIAFGSIVRNNQVVATGGSTIFAPNASATGILVAAPSIAGTGPRVINNDVINNVKQGSGIARGIDFAAVAGLAVNNRITGADIGIDFSSATGKYRDNLTFDVGTPYVGGTNAGNNN